MTEKVSVRAASKLVFNLSAMFLLICPLVALYSPNPAQNAPQTIPQNASQNASAPFNPCFITTYINQQTQNANWTSEITMNVTQCRNACNFTAKQTSACYHIYQPKDLSFKIWIYSLLALAILNFLEGILEWCGVKKMPYNVLIKDSDQDRPNEYELKSK